MGATSSYIEHGKYSWARDIEVSGFDVVTIEKNVL